MPTIDNDDDDDDGDDDYDDDDDDDDFNLSSPESPISQSSGRIVVKHRFCTRAITTSPYTWRTGTLCW